MAEPDWPTSAEVNAATAERLRALLDNVGGLVAEVGRTTLSGRDGVLSDRPHSLTTVLTAGSCKAAGRDWRAALWPAVGAECMMAAGDLFDDAADADAAGPYGPPVLLTVAAGLLSLSSLAVTRVVEDGADAATAAALAGLLGDGFTRAANGQAANLESRAGQVDAVTAYRQAGAKSGPLGELIARLGARTATDDVEIVQLLGEFGRRLAVRSQLINDLRDAAPEGDPRKADVRTGARTVPLAFTGSSGPPAGLDAAQLQAWEEHERARIASGGGLAAASALAEAERLYAIAALDRLEARGHPVAGLRQLL
jgi:geranylgeranyl pyrophosphate synthase